MILIGIGCLISFVALICCILVIVEMFKRGEQTMGIITIIGVVICGFGYPLALVYGWMKSKEWNIQKLMVAFTTSFLLSLVFLGVGYGMLIPTLMNEIKRQDLQNQQEAEKVLDEMMPDGLDINMGDNF